MLTSKQRAYLRSLAQKLSPIFQIGKGGISEEICLQLDNALRARELVKVHTLENSPYTAREAAEAIAAAVDADVVCVIGTKFVLYKESDERPQIILP